MPLMFRKRKKQRERFLASSQAGPDEISVYEPLPNAETPNIRLLTLFPAEEFEKIRCQLSEETLHDAEYEALSYCWGDDKRLTTISCNGAKLHITPNLKKALNDLRYSNRPRVLWVDAICINQSDILEKEHQVNMMGDIYRRARRVVVHLEATGPGLGLAFGTLRFFHALYQDLVSGHRELPDVLDAADRMTVESYKGYVPLVVGLTCTGFISPLPYFSRMWVAQEVALAREISIMYGPQEIEWNVYAEGMVMRSLLLLMGRQDALFHSVHDMSVLRLIMLRERVEKEALVQELDLLNLLNHTRTLHSTNAVDKVYGVFGFTKSDLQQMGLRPDYSKPVEDLYIDVAIALLKESINLDILSITRPSAEARGSQVHPRVDFPDHIWSLLVYGSH